LYLQIYITYLF